MRRFLALAFATSLALALGGGCVLDWSRGAGGSGSLPTETCPPGAPSCQIECSTSPCAALCEDATTCNVVCNAGDCVIDCAGAGSCVVECAGGGCAQNCADATGCAMSCAGGGCTQDCPSGLGCSCDGCS